MEAELLKWKDINRERRRCTKAIRKSYMRQSSLGVATAQKEVWKGGMHKTPQYTPYKSDLMPISMTDVSFRYFGGENIIQGVSISVPQGNLIGVFGPPGCGKKTLLNLIAHKTFPCQGNVFIPTHLRILCVSMDPVILKLSAFRNLTFAINDLRELDVPRIISICDMLGMAKTLELIRQDLRYHPRQPLGEQPSWQPEAGSPEFEKVLAGCPNILAARAGCLITEMEDGSWIKRMSSTDLSLIHLARAFIMNAETMILQRPLRTFYSKTSQKILDTMRLHVQERGLSLSTHDVLFRRPRTLFFSAENVEQAAEADVIWQMAPLGDTNVVPCRVAPKTMDHAFKHLNMGLPKRVLLRRAFESLKPSKTFRGSSK